MAAFPGMGVFLENQGGTLFLAWYHYGEDGTSRWWSAGIYDEGRRGWLYPGQLGGDGKAFTKQGGEIFKQEAWNHVKVEAKGDTLKTWLNGTARAEIKDSMTPAGFIALQVHGVGKQVEPLEIRWRNIRLKELP